MGDPSATFAVNLTDGTSGSANAAAGAIANLQAKMDSETKSLREMQKAMKRLQGGTSVNVAAFRELTAKIEKSKASIASSQSKFIELGGTFGKTARRTRKASSSFTEMSGALQGTSGPLGALGGTLSKLGPLLTNPITLVVALTAALLAMVVAIGAATAALLKYGVAQSDVRRNEALRLEGLNTLRRSMGRTTASVAEMQAAIDRASDSTNLGRDTLAGYARQLGRTGLSGAALTDAVEAMGIAAQVQGDRGAARFRALAMNARLTGGSVRALAEDYRNRLGPIARRQMLSLENQSQRLHRSLDRIFSGLRIEAFLGAIEQVQSLFSQSTATGRALKVITEALFQPMLDQLGELGPVAKRFFQGMVIAALLFTIALLKIRNGFREAFGDSEMLKGLDATKIALGAGVAVGGLFAAAIVTAGIVVGTLAAGLALLVATALAIPLAMQAAYNAIKRLSEIVVSFFESTDFAAIGSRMIDGLIRGITSGARRVANAVRGVASSAADTFRNVLGIRSPSTVFAEYGENISRGVSEGVDAGSGGVNESVSGLVEVPQGGGLSGGGSSVSFTFGDVVISADTNSTSASVAEGLRDAIASILEGVNVELSTQ